MARLNVNLWSGADIAGRTLALLQNWLARGQWLLRAGGPRLYSGLLIVLALLAALMWQHRQAQRAQLQSALTAQRAVLLAATPLSGTVDAEERRRLRAFDQRLLPHADIPLVLQDLLQLAATSGLSVQRGEYRTQIDVAGGFLRYGMSLPVSGEATAVERFMQAALRQHPMLLLDSWRLQRQPGNAARIEARLQWVILTRLPTPPGPDAVATKVAP